MSGNLGDLINSKNSQIIEPLFQKYPKLRVKYKFLIKNSFKIKTNFFTNNISMRVVEEKWDYLIILDACRFDYFNKHNNFNQGELKRVSSVGSNTEEWFMNNFYKGLHKEIIYISSNPQISDFMVKKRLGHNPFYEIENVWNYGWNEEYKTVLPETTTEAALDKIQKDSDKRYIIHYMQPHIPFINTKDLVRDGIAPIEDRSKDKGNRIWKDAEKGKVDLEKLEEAYKDNLEAVLPSVKNLVEKLEGKIVITSDHGNVFGEYFLFGHPSKIYIPELIKVPWLIIEK